MVLSKKHLMRTILLISNNGDRLIGVLSMMFLDCYCSVLLKYRFRQWRTVQRDLTFTYLGLCLCDRMNFDFNQ